MLTHLLEVSPSGKLPQKLENDILIGKTERKFALFFYVQEQNLKKLIK